MRLDILPSRAVRSFIYEAVACQICSNKVEPDRGEYNEDRIGLCPTLYPEFSQKPFVKSVLYLLMGDSRLNGS